MDTIISYVKDLLEKKSTSSEELRENEISRQVLRNHLLVRLQQDVVKVLIQEMPEPFRVNPVEHPDWQWGVVATITTVNNDHVKFLGSVTVNWVSSSWRGADGQPEQRVDSIVIRFCRIVSGDQEFVRASTGIFGSSEEQHHRAILEFRKNMAEWIVSQGYKL